MKRSNKVQYSSEKNMLLGSKVFRGQDSLIILQKVSKNNIVDHP